MFGKHVSEIEYSDIEYLVNVRKEQEGYHLDYKKSMGNPDKAKNELAKDISSFANSSGGFLIIGIDDDRNILGVEKEINNKRIDEWINQVVNSNIDPYVSYFDPKIIDIPESEKVLVVIHIPESTKKPHMVNELFQYFVRINDSSKKANHSQVRDMFEFSRNRTNEFNDFLKKRNLFDVDNKNFAQNRNTGELLSDVPEQTGFKKPVVLFSLIPKFPNNEKFDISHQDLKRWLEQNEKGYAPLPSKHLFYSWNKPDLKLDGTIFKFHSGNDLSSYFEILNSGFIEAGFSRTFFWPFRNRNEKMFIAGNLTYLVGYEMLILGWAKNFYDYIGYYDDVLLQISFSNVLGIKLFGFHHELKINPFYETDDTSNKQNQNLKLEFAFKPKDLTSEQILNNAKRHSEKICRAFGLTQELCFVNDEISVNHLSYLQV